jgi:transcriptional antiterminator Rof (Rho-off)
MEKLKFKNGRCCIAVGEGVKNRHEVLEAEGVEVYKDGGKLLIKTGDKGTSLIHPEHGTIVLPEHDEIEIVIQEEYSDLNEWRKVQD